MWTEIVGGTEPSGPQMKLSKAPSPGQTGSNMESIDLLERFTAQSAAFERAFAILCDVQKYLQESLVIRPDPRQRRRLFPFD